MKDARIETSTGTESETYGQQADGVDTLLIDVGVRHDCGYGMEDGEDRYQRPGRKRS